MTETKRKAIFIILVSFILILASSYYFFVEKPLKDSNDGKNGTTTKTINIGGVNIDITGPGASDVIIEPVDFPKPPKYPRKINYPVYFTEETRKIFDQRFSEVIDRLNDNVSIFDSWIELGLRYNQVEDYDGAREAWEYASVISPSNIVSFNNLGDIYHYRFKDFKKAEENFLTALRNDPKYTLSYLNLHDLYRLSYKTNTTSAEDVLKEGIKENPKSVDLLMALATYYKSKGDSKNAKSYYNKALGEARELGNSDLVKTIELEISNL